MYVSLKLVKLRYIEWFHQNRNQSAMAVGANGDVPPTFPVVMDNPGDQAGLMVHEFGEYVQEELILGIWLSVMWMLISMAISYGFYTMMMQGPFPNKETESAHIFEELENNRVLSNYFSRSQE